jgi:hypothetical protein
MSLKKILLPAALIVVMALVAPLANAQTMGEYATTTAGVGMGGGSMGPSFSLPSPSIGSGDSGGSGTWGASRLGGSFEERAGALSGSGMGASFEDRAAELTGGHSSNESRWPGTGLSATGKESRFGAEDRFKTEDRFTANDRFSSSSRWPGSSFQDHMGLDTHFNSVNGN